MAGHGTIRTLRPPALPAIAEPVPSTTDRQHLVALRQVGDAIATNHLQAAEFLRSIVDLAVVAMGDGAALRILTADQRAVERDLVAHQDGLVRQRLSASLRQSALQPVPVEGLVAEVVEKGRLISTIGPTRHRQPEYQQNFRERVFDQAEHFMVAPVRHNGVVLGKMLVFRTDGASPYQEGDDDVLQLLADGAGAAVAEARAWQVAARERDEQLAALREAQSHLLERLAGMEARERSQLAESIHDEPVQRLVAAMLRLDTLAARMDEPIGKEIGVITDQLEISVAWLRDLIVVALSPADLSEGLGPALSGLAGSIFAGSRTEFVFVGPDHVALSAPAKETAYRIMREALMNARKHARAATVTLHIRRRGDAVILALSDDGIGSSSLDAGPGHLGIATMRARADAAGGRLDIDSLRSIGTVVTLTLAATVGEPA